MRLRVTVALIFVLAIAPAAYPQTAMSAKSLDQSLDLGRQFLLNCQRPDGSFIYELDAASGKDLGTRYATREMGGLWALASLHRQSPTKATADAVVKSLNFHGGHAKRTPEGARYLCEPLAKEGATATMALHVLAMLDFLAAEDELDAAARKAHEQNLADSVKFLVSLRRPGGMFFQTYRGSDGKGTGTPSPATDGPALLALVRAAKQTEDESVRNVALELAGAMYEQYVKVALRNDPNSEPATTFFPWGAVAFYELFTSEWPGTQTYAARTIVMARWMIDVRRVVERGHLAAPAYQGLVVAWDLSRRIKDPKNQQYIAAAITKGLPNLMKFQIGAPTSTGTVPASYLKSKTTRGGVLTKENDPQLRIDVTQQHIGAILFVREMMFRPSDVAQ